MALPWVHPRPGGFLTISPMLPQLLNVYRSLLRCTFRDHPLAHKVGGVLLGCCCYLQGCPFRAVRERETPPMPHARTPGIGLYAPEGSLVSKQLPKTCCKNSNSWLCHTCASAECCGALSAPPPNSPLSGPAYERPYSKLQQHQNRRCCC